MGPGLDQTSTRISGSGCWSSRRSQAKLGLKLPGCCLLRAKKIQNCSYPRLYDLDFSNETLHAGEQGAKRTCSTVGAKDQETGPSQPDLLRDDLFSRLQYDSSARQQKRSCSAAVPEPASDEALEIDIWDSVNRLSLAQALLSTQE